VLRVPACSHICHLFITQYHLGWTYPICHSSAVRFPLILHRANFTFAIAHAVPEATAFAPMCTLTEDISYADKLDFFWTTSGIHVLSDFMLCLACMALSPLWMPCRPVLETLLTGFAVQIPKTVFHERESGIVKCGAFTR
jgi:hypothetical protein